MNHPSQKILLCLLFPIFLSILLSFQAADSQTATFTGKVVGVSDGDTIKVMRAGQAVKVRLHGIDCPEKKQPCGTKAKRYASEMTFGKGVMAQTTGRYGRIVGEVILPEGSSLNIGLAESYRTKK